MKKILFVLLVLFLICFIGLAQTEGDDLLKPDGAWLYPQFLTYRPGNGKDCDVNPPRFSWPYVPNVIVESNKTVPYRKFVFQLSKSPDFAKPEFEILTEYNFYNALPVLENAKWYWRIGYDFEGKTRQWSPVRYFSISEKAAKWDRTFILQAAQNLAQKSHPRLSPKNINWDSWLKSLKNGSFEKKWLDGCISLMDETMKEKWWEKFPETDKRKTCEYNEYDFDIMGSRLALAVFLYKATGEKKYLKAKDHFLTLAKYPKGGVASPEFHGAKAKWTTRLTEYLALCYDWLYNEMSKEERAIILSSIKWRLEATFLKAHSWKAGDEMDSIGIAVLTGSHPYENTMWSLPAALLTTGDLEISDQLTELCLHYLTGVTVSHGPDEGWNEGFSYGIHKAMSMFSASLYVKLLLPELNLEKNPVYPSLGEWFSHIAPIGITRLPFGDLSDDPDGDVKQRQMAILFRYFAWMNGDGRYMLRSREYRETSERPALRRPWFEIFVPESVGTFEERKYTPKTALFPEAGWVMVSSKAPTPRENFTDAVGMIFQCRPRGGYSHSFRAENDFAWYAYGQTLTAGGGGMAYSDIHSRSSLSHNVVLINGIGQEWDHWNPKFPYVGRILAYQKKKDYIFWVGEAKNAYQTYTSLERCLRYVIFLDEKYFIIFDDLAVKDDAEPARFSWLYHIFPKVDLKINEKDASFSYTMNDVNAVISFAGNPQDIEIQDLQGRRGYENLITGENMYEETVRILKSKGKALPEEMQHNIWVTNKKPAREWCFLSVLSASSKSGKLPEISFKNNRIASILFNTTKPKTVSFDPEYKGDINIDPEKYRRYAKETEMGKIPSNNKKLETVMIDGDKFQIEWLAWEDFDETWLNRWAVEGDSLVRTENNKLYIGRLENNHLNTATIWYRPDLPPDVIVRFRAKPVPPEENNACNLNLFLHAREPDGSELKFGRSGVYKEYHQIPNYILTFVGGCKPGWSRLRKDPGFNMLHESEIRSEVNKEYTIVVTSYKGRIRYYINGKKHHDYQDKKPLPHGKFGIRSWSTTGYWDQVEFGRIVSAP